jgi:hypothetical protein
MKSELPQPAGARPPQPAGRKVFDVMRPGRTPAPSTSKPVIVGHKPQVRDTSVAVQGIGLPVHRPLMNAAKRVIVQPTTPSAAAPASEIKPTPPSLAASQPTTPPAAPATPLIPTPGPPSATTPSIPEPPVAVPPSPHTLQNEPTAPEDMLLDDIRPLIDETHEKIVSRKVGPGEFPWKNILLIATIMVLLVLLLDILADAEFVNTTLPHTDFL